MTRVATLSKYPPYISGHSHQAQWLGRAFADLLGEPQHQVTYCGSVPVAYRDDRIVVHHAAPANQRNHRVPDGHLAKAVAARMATLPASAGVDSFLALYVDPHAAIALRAARAARLAGHRVTVAVSVEGSDLTSSMHRHLDDGEAAVLLGDVWAADVVMAVSRRAAQLLVEAAERALSPAAAAEMADRVVLRYPGLPPESFLAPTHQEVAAWRAGHGIPFDSSLVGTFVRLVPEKGIDLILQLAQAAGERADLWFVIAGSGPMAADLRSEIRERGLSRVRLLTDLDRRDAHLLRAASDVALLPSRRAPDWEETFGIAALEFQALGVPVLASDSPAFAESCAVPQFRMGVDATPREWLAAIDGLLRQRPRFSAVARDFAERFTSARSASIVLEGLERARRGSGLT